MPNKLSLSNLRLTILLAALLLLFLCPLFLSCLVLDISKIGHIWFGLFAVSATYGAHNLARSAVMIVKLINPNAPEE